MKQASQPAWERHVSKMDVGFPLRSFNLDAMSDEELVACSKAMSIGLSLDEMKSARAYFASQGRHPTDVEMEALGQAWSEHCCYKSSKPVLKRHVYGLNEHKIICREDAGVLPFDGDYYYVPKLESHNHPSAVEPYGGAATGVGGVLRDVVCMGAQPVAMIDPIFFGPLDLPYESLPSGVKHPKFLLQGVVAGIRDYGNRVGIPTVAGGITFHPGYTSNCLVNVGCVGIMHKKNLTHSRAGGVGDIFVYLGNSTGRDGIHGVAFASEELTEESEEDARPAVQVGDAILKEPLVHVTLELIEKKLVTGCKDFGGGGLSCVAGELAYDAGFGCHIELEKIPTKVPNMAPWEIWVSESQERMMVTCTDAQVEELLAVARKWDVQAAVCGRVITEKVNRVTYRGVPVLDFELEFSTGGPVYDRPMTPRAVHAGKAIQFPQPNDYNATLVNLLKHPNIMSKEYVIRQYDHEVRANTLLKPLQGVVGLEGPGDATVLKPVHDSNKGLALCSDINPYYTERDPYWGAMAAMDETVRNLAAVGARLDSICDNLNFGNPQKPERMWELEHSAKALGDACKVLGIPFASGNVSLYNEAPTGPIAPTPTILGLGILDDFTRATSMDLKAEGNKLYVIGKTKREFGGSAYFQQLKLDGEAIPRSDIATTAKHAAMLIDSIHAGHIRAAHDCSEGGLGVTIAEMAFAGQFGVDVDITKLGDLRADEKLFSESQGRWVVEVAANAESEFVAKFGNAAILLGKVVKVPRVKITEAGITLIETPIKTLRDAWANEFAHLLGVTA